MDRTYSHHHGTSPGLRPGQGFRARAALAKYDVMLCVTRKRQPERKLHLVGQSTFERTKTMADLILAATVNISVLVVSVVSAVGFGMLPLMAIRGLLSSTKSD
jgi:hypothetical protein